ncbi:MAG: GNAT family N-acetyltransferase [Gemmatimonadota bacterium]
MAQYEDFFGALPAELASNMGIEMKRAGSRLRLTARGYDHPMFNREMGLALDPDGARELEEIPRRAAEHFAACGVRRWMLQVLPHVESEGFREAAGEEGLVRLRGWAKHLGPARADLEAPSDLRTVRIGDRAGGSHAEGGALVEAWARIVVGNFGLPSAFTPWLEGLAKRERWRLYLAMDDDIPVGSGALFLSDHPEGRFGHLTFAATVPEHRGRGAQSTLLARRVQDAFRAGARWVVSETDEALATRPNPSTRNLERLGFPVAYVRANWGPPKPAG